MPTHGGYQGVRPGKPGEGRSLSTGGIRAGSRDREGRPGQKRATWTQAPHTMVRPAGLHSLFSPVQAWQGEQSRSTPIKGAIEGRGRTLSPLYKQLPLSTCCSDGVSHTRHRLLLCGPSEKDGGEAEAGQLPRKAVSQCLNGESRGWGGQVGAPGKPRTLASHCCGSQTSLEGSCQAVSPIGRVVGRPREGA